MGSRLILSDMVSPVEIVRGLAAKHPIHLPQLKRGHSVNLTMY
ncbi:MAG: hypothetical protein DID90_2727554048 [Candidatus Nitrotoga sp. LAW]|nr:MAG: hypothetical protein DID90_2727554048 [Candidatus Nitrotoga sp. LAW]